MENIRKEEVSTMVTDVIDDMLEGFQLIDREWRYLYVNKTVAKQGKRKSEQLLGKTMMECYPGIDQTPLFAELRKCMDEGANIRMENEFTFPDGTSGWFQLYIHSVTHGIMILSIDITDWKIAEGVLREKITELKKLTEVTVGREVRMQELKERIRSLIASLPEGFQAMKES